MRLRINLFLVLAPLLAAQPPLIHRELLFASPEITGAQLSPDGKFITFIKPWKGTFNLWIKKSGEPMSAAHPLTAESHSAVSSYLWTRDAKHVCFVKDSDGGGNFNLYAVDPADPVPPGAEAPPARDLTGLKGVSIQLYGAPKSDPDLVYVGINDRDPAWPDLYKIKASNGAKLLIRENTERVSAWFFDGAGRLRMGQRTSEDGNQEVLRVEPNTITTAYTCGGYETCTPVRMDKEGKRAYVITNKGAALDLAALVLLDLATGKTETVDADPQHRADFGSAGFSDQSGDLIFTSYSDERVRRYFRDKSFEADFKWLEAKLPGQEVSVGSLSADEQFWLVNVFADTEPGETYLFDRHARTVALQFKLQEALPRASLSPMQAVRYKSSDGLEISAYLTLPKGVPAKNLPTLVLPHGGPWTRDAWGFNAMAQLFANRGYAVLMPNYRGSTGYGKKFLHAADGEWGRKMQGDITAGVQYLTSRGIADAARVGIVGSAFGGYVALAGAAFTPDLYHAAVDISGPANLFTMLDSIPPTFTALREMMFARTANPSTPEGAAWLKERSPVGQADKIKTALLVVQGARDPQVLRADADRIVVTLRDSHIPVEYLLAPDEGHGMAREANFMAALGASERFLARHLQGRGPEEESPEVTRRIAEITVDPAGLVARAAGTGDVPKLVADLKPGYYRYQAKLSLNGKEYPVTTATVVEESDAAWSVTEMAETPLGVAIDHALLDKGTLTVRKRSLKQGETTVEVDFIEGRASGKVAIRGQEQTVSADLGGAPFADAAGSLQSIGCLPLADGFAMSYRNFDLQRQRPRMMQLLVAGSESVTVPAGTFDTFRVQLSSAESAGDKAMVWIAKDTRQPVRILTVSAAMGGATMTAELLPQ